MKNKKINLIVLLITVCMAISVCFAGCLPNADYEEMYNDDSQIARGSSNIIVGSVETSVNDKYKLSCSSLSGVYIALNSFTVNESTSANLSFELNGGKGKVVLVKGDSVYTLTEESYDGAIDFENIPEGKYKLKIVGVKAEFKLTFSY